MALARLGVPPRFVGAVGDDAFGSFAMSSLRDEGVDVRGVAVATDEPTVQVIVVVPPDGDRLVYVWPHRGGAHGALGVETAVGAVEGARWVHVSGICLRVSPAREAVVAAMERARDRGVPVSFDLNLRLENWGWDEGFRAAVDAAVRHADVVLGGAFDEVGALAGRDDPVEAAVSLAAAERTVVARLGADGAIACSAAGVVRVPGFAVDVVDTVGAGDAFDAGFITAQLAGAGLEQALRWGNATAALTIGGAGARSSPRLGAVEALLGSG